MKILAIGKNYVTNTDDINSLKTGKQLIFSKPSSSLVFGNNNVEFPSFTSNLLYEVELVLKIGKKGKNINLKDATSYISDIAVGIDYTAKDILNEIRETKGPWELAKGFDGAAPISDFIAIENFSDINDINFTLSINGAMKQIGNTSFMIYNFAEIITYVSQFITLEPGDLIFTGTPATGAGQIFKGDHLKAAIEGEKILDFKMV